MGILSKLISYLIHPLLVPTIGTVFYFMVTPKYSPTELILGNLIPIFILTALIPLGSLLILNQFGMMRSRLLLTSEERIYPLLIFLALLLLILLRVIPNNFTVELYYFFMGIALSVTSCLLLALMGKVVSLHMVGIGTLLMFIAMLSFHFEKNIVVGNQFVYPLYRTTRLGTLVLKPARQGSGPHGLAHRAGLPTYPDSFLALKGSIQLCLITGYKK